MKTPLNDVEKMALSVTRAIGSVTSIIIHTLFFLGAFTLVFFGFDFDRVFLVLTTVVSLEAIYLSIFIQLSVNYQARAIANVEQDIDVISHDVGEIAEDVGEIAEDVEDIQEAHEEIQEDIEEIQKDVEDIQEAHEEIQEDIEEIQKDVDEIQEDVEEIAEDVEEIQEDQAGEIKKKDK